MSGENESLPNVAAAAKGASSEELWIVRAVSSGETDLCAVPTDVAVSRGLIVVVPTRYGQDTAVVIGPAGDAVRRSYGQPIRLVRVADERDLARVRDNEERERRARSVCRQKVHAIGLEMSVVSAHYVLDEPKLVFFFTAEARVDFRDLVKELVAAFRMRIELRQIGVREETRIVGGIGGCGRVLCCHGISDRLQSVSIKMAKVQSISLRSTTVSGPCGRLLCCLAYEYEFYSEGRKNLPAEGYKFAYDGTTFVIAELNLVAGTVRIEGADGRVLDLPLCRLVRDQDRGGWSLRESC